MKRRNFIQGALGATATLAAPAIVGANQEWKLLTSLPAGLPGPGVSAMRFAERVGIMSDGKLSVKVFGGGELVAPFGTQEAVENGVAEMYQGSGSWFAGRDIAHSFFGVVPFGLDPGEFYAWIYHGGGQELWDELTLPRGFKCFVGGASGVQTAGWYNKPIETVADLQGLNFRITGFGAQVMKKLGVNAQAMPPGEIFPALQSGALDGAEWVGPALDMSFGLHKIMSHMYTPSFSDIHGGLEYGINKAAWDGLDAGLQTVVQAAIEAEVMRVDADIFYANVIALEKIKALDSVSIGEFSDEIWQALADASREVMAEVRESDPLVGKIHDSFFAFAKRASALRGDYEAPLYQQRAKYFS